MPRMARVVIPGLPHHIIQRGNYQQDVFITGRDRHKYLKWLSEYSSEYGVVFWAWCLMRNHVHFVAVPDKLDSLANTFDHAHHRYSQYFNTRLERRGHLWQGRFYSCVLDNVHAYRAVRYIENNPVRAGLVQKAWEYPWSSAKAHVEGRSDVLITKDTDDFARNIDDWQDYLGKGEQPDWAGNLMQATLAGRPLGSHGFMDLIEKNVGRRLHALHSGRPKKARVTRPNNR